MTVAAPVPVWTPDPATVAGSQLSRFVGWCERATGRSFPDFPSFHSFSVESYPEFWRLFLEWSGLLLDGEAHPPCRGEAVETAEFFPGLRLSYVENLLRERDATAEEGEAVVALAEGGDALRLTRSALRERVRRRAAALQAWGLRPGDRVVAIARNDADAVVACLAAAAVGALWSSVSPDLGEEAMLNRFRQLDPVLLFAHSGYRYQGVWRAADERVREVVAGLPSLRGVAALGEGPLPAELAAPPLRPEELEGATPLRTWPRFPFNHPLFVLFSSGTTGAPKCIVHGAGGTLLEHVKEHRLHSDLGAADRLLFQTSTGWMMWNWQLSALASGTTVVLYDGSVSYPAEDELWRLVSRERVTVFGTSPAYLQYCRDAGIAPRERVDLASLRAMQSTGSILFDSQYDWVRDHVKALPLQSISGGTDIIGCFVLGNPNLPVYRGESQCLGLGMDVRALPPPGAADGGAGELVCARPFPSRPLGLFGDADRRRFHEAYFSQNPGVWTHGDTIAITERGTARILGRSDGVLNIRGVRIGPAEIYHVLQDFPEVAESMAVEQSAPEESGGSRLVLLVVLKGGAILDRALTLRIKKEISRRASPVHVPAVVAAVAELPTTFSGKRSERAARDAINGRAVANLGALRNPASLETLRDHPALRA